MSVPFLDTFENLDNWDYIGWAISSFGSCPTQPCARWGSENGTNYLKMNINVESGQILSFWVYLNGYDTTLNLYINNVSMWSYVTPFGSGTFSTIIYPLTQKFQKTNFVIENLQSVIYVQTR